MSTFVLLVMLLANGRATAVSMESFGSEQACQAASASVMQSVPAKQSVVVRCLPKDHRP